MNRKTPFSVQKNLRSVNFICSAPSARCVFLVGDFNKWDPIAHPMRHMPDGGWLLNLMLGHGHHRYAFLVDGAIAVDPRAQGVTRNEQGQKVSLVSVS